MQMLMHARADKATPNPIQLFHTKLLNPATCLTFFPS